VTNRVAVTKPCREHRINDLVYCLEGFDIWVVPRRVRISNLFDNEANEFIAEVLTNVIWEVLDPRVDPHVLDHPWEGEGRERELLELHRDILLVGRGRGCIATYA
jgi:hypothetical protein